MKLDATLVTFALFAVGPPAGIVWAATRDHSNPFTLTLVGVMLGFVGVAGAAYALVLAAERRWPDTNPAMQIRRYVTDWVLVVALLGGSVYVFLLLRG